MLLARRTFLGLFALTLVLAGSGRAAAQPAAAQQFVQQQTDAAQALLRRPAGDARNRQLAQLIDGMLDYQELGRRSLGREWGTHSEAERTQFLGLLQQLVERAYQDNLQRTAQFNIEVLGTDADGDAFRVRTRASSRTNRRAPAVSLDYSVRQVGGRWRVFDVHTDGVSLVATYRRQFTRIIGSEGWAGLITRMQTRAAQGGSSL